MRLIRLIRWDQRIYRLRYKGANKYPIKRKHILTIAKFMSREINT